MKKNDKLTPADVKAMPLAEFQKRFGFMPIDALDKAAYAMLGKRISPITRDLIAIGLLEPIDLTNVVME